MFSLSIQLFSQDLLTGLTYSIAVPTGETKNFVSEDKLYGINIRFKKICIL